ncbi:MAG: alginate export family protein [Armatimonadetes bacterium]|nr:alginate export family protein [Armatimonadota bacterium]
MLFDSHPVDQDKIEIKPLYEFRYRLERRLERDFSSAVSDDRTDHLGRLKVGIEGKKGDRLKFGLQYLYAHAWSELPTKRVEDEAGDLSLAYVQFKSAQSTATIGRQKIVVGTERLIGTAEWVNVPRSMDGIRFQTPVWDAFAFKFGVGQPKPQDARVFGLSGQWKYGRSMVVQKHDRVNGRSVDITTLAHEFNRKVGDWTIEAEAALQFGKVQSRDQRAWAWHASASRPFGPKTKAYVEADSASGGSNADTVMTFDNLYPTNHKFYGSMDLQAWKNMDEFAVGVVHKPMKQLDLSASWRTFSLRDPSDAWYGAGGAPNKGANGDFVDPTGSSGRRVGSEIDLEATFRPTDKVSLGLGIGLFEPGSFVKKLNGGSADRQTWLYFQVAAKF